MSMYPQSGFQKPFQLEYGRANLAMSKFFNMVYAWMAVGLAVTAVVAYACSQSQVALQIIYGGGRGFMMVCALGMFAIAWGVQVSALRINANVATALFMVYAALMGAMLSAIFLIYSMQTITSAFLITGGTFAAMSIYGFVTKRDLTAIGSFLVMCVMGLFIASIVNIFVASNGLSWLITYAVLVVFIGITAYETQKLKNMAIQFTDHPDIAKRIAIIGSLMLYISFINIFLSILRIMGDRK